MSSPSPAQSLPPVTVLCGFLGAGKTTLLRHLLKQGEGRKWAVVVNDVAAMNIDAQLVAQAGASRTVELGNGCVCCSVRDELAETVAELAAQARYDHIIVETTGVAEPRAIADLFLRKNAFGRSLGDFARLHALVTVVDTPHFLREWVRSKTKGDATERSRIKPTIELMVEQVETADVLVLNKCDAASPEELAQVETILRGLNARAEVFRTEQGQLPAEVLLDRPRFDALETMRSARWVRVLSGAGGDGTARPAVAPYLKAGRHEEDYGIMSFVYEARRPFVGAKFAEVLKHHLPAGLLRAKGFLWMNERPADIGFLSVAGGQVRCESIGTWAAELRDRGVVTDAEIPAAARAKWQEPHGDRRQELVFIGVGLDEAALRAALDACLGDA